MHAAPVVPRPYSFTILNMGLLVRLCIAGLAVGLVGAVDLPKVTSSGYLKVRSHDDAELFYMYYEAQDPLPHIVDDTPIVLWLNGGPGCSSMIGNFYEIGPQRITSNGTLVDFDFTWNKHFDLLFIDQPLGTGLSVSQVTPPSQATVARQMYKALVNFFDANPGLRSRPLFLAGESYAGHYLPALAHLIIDRGMAPRERRNTRLEMQEEDDMTEDNKKRTHEKTFNLAGVIIGSGLTDARAQVQTHADVMHSLGLIDEVQRAHARDMQQRIVRLIDEEEWDAAHKARDTLLNYLEHAAGVATLLDVRRSEPYRDQLVSDYLNREEVREAIHAKPGQMEACNKAIPEIMTEDIMRSYAGDVAAVVSRVPVLLFQGQFDVKDGYPSTVAWLRDLPWVGAAHFQMAERKVLEVDGEKVGYWKKFAHLTHVMVLDAGHMVPHDQPKAAYDLVTGFVDDCLHRTS